MYGFLPQLQTMITEKEKKQDDLNVVPQRVDAGGRDAVAQEVELGDGEDALGEVEGKAVGGQDGEEGT